MLGRLQPGTGNVMRDSCVSSSHCHGSACEGVGILRLVRYDARGTGQGAPPSKPRPVTAWVRNLSDQEQLAQPGRGSLLPPLPHDVQKPVSTGGRGH